MRRARLLEISATIEAAIQQGRGKVGHVLETLSERERSDLINHFPEILDRLAGARSLGEMGQVLQGAKALLSQSRERRLSEGDLGLALRAFVAARVPESKQRETWEKLREIEHASREGVLKLTWLWARYRLLGKR